MKTKQTEKETVKQAIVVPEAIKQAVKAYLTADAAAKQAAEGANMGMLNCGTKMASLYKTKDDARPVLKQAFDDAGRDSSDITNASVISKILTLGYPENAKAAESLKNALANNLGTNKAIAAARNSIRVSKDGKETKVDKKTNQGGHNKKKPLEAFRDTLTLAFTAADTAKIDDDQVAVILTEIINACKSLDLEAIAAKMAE